MNTGLIQRRSLWRTVMVIVALLGAFHTACVAETAFYDGFNDPNSGWLTYIDESVVFEYVDGRYSIEVLEPDTLRWTWAPMSSPLPEAEFRVEIAVLLPEVPSNGAEGESGSVVVTVPLFGMTMTLGTTDSSDVDAGGSFSLVVGISNENLLLFSIDFTGWYRVDQMISGEWTEPLAVSSEPLSLLPNPAGNVIAVESRTAGSLEMYVNGIAVVSVSTQGAQMAWVGLAATSPPQGTTKVEFDSFVVETW